MCTKSVLLIAKQTPNCALNNQKMCFIIPYLRHSSDLVGKENCFKIAPSYKLCLTAFRVFSSSDNPSLFPLYVQLSFFNCPGKCTNAISGLLTTYQVSDSWDINGFVVFLLSFFHSDYNWKTITDVINTWQNVPLARTQLSEVDVDISITCHSRNSIV